MQLRPFYKHAPIRRLDTLATALGVQLAALNELADHVPDLYRIRHKPKGNGEYREIADARQPLKAIQGCIKDLFLSRVEYPRYLMGGIRDRVFPRDYKRNAELHAGARVLIREDIQDFFPSVTFSHVYDIWTGIFRFEPAVSDLLTRLTTRLGALPQGAKTSNHLANLIFWRAEPHVYQYFCEQRLRYTRLIDDIIVSSPTRRLTHEEIGDVVARIVGMVGRYSFRVKRRKHAVESGNGRMTVNKVVVNRKTSLPSEKRSEIRTAVRSVETIYPLKKQEKRYAKLFERVAGQVSTLKRFHVREGKDLQERLTKVTPEKSQRA